MDFREALSEVIGDLACASASATRSLQRNFADPNITETQQGTQNWIAQQQLTFCERDPFAQPFRPGVCSILYSVTVTYQVLTPEGSVFDGVFTAGTVVWGPIGTASVRRFTLPGPPASERFFITLAHHGPSNQPPTALQRTDLAGPAAAAVTSEISILGISSEPFPAGSDGSCPTLPPADDYDPEDYTYPVTLPYTPPGGVTVNLPLIAVIGLFYIDADLNVNMPVTFTVRPTVTNNIFPGLTIQANLNFNTGDVEIDWIPGDEPNTLPPALPNPTRPPVESPDSPVPPQPPDVPNPDPDTDETEAGRGLVAALVTTTLRTPTAPQSQIGQDLNPDIYVPSLGYISFAIRTASGSVGWTNDIPVKTLRAYIPCPVSKGAIDVQGTPGVGVEWVITPIYEETLIPQGAG